MSVVTIAHVKLFFWLLCVRTTWWCGNRFHDGYIMVAFSLGYLVVISTHMQEIGREQFCAKYD
jgi:hypothetical protein